MIKVRKIKQMNEKLLTISIAAYNVEKCLQYAIKSCLIKKRDLRKRLEIIIVNDGSSDKTSETAHDYERKFPDVIRVIDKKNGGYGSTVNTSIDAAKGKYIKLLDADDCYDTKQLELFMENLASLDVDLAITDFVFCYKHNNKKVTYSLPTSILTDLKGIDVDLSVPSVCFKTKLLKDNRITLSEKIFYTDTEFVIYPLYYVKTMCYFPYMIYQYNIGDEAQSVSFASRIDHIKDIEVLNNRLQNYYFQHKIINGTKQMIEKRMAVSEQFYISTLLLLSNKKDTKRILVNYDRTLKKMLPGVYRRMNTKCILFLRKSNYWGYRICAIYVKLFQR